MIPMKRIYKPLLIVLALGGMLSGCMVGPKLEKPVVETEDQFRFDSIAGDTMINLAWWDLFSEPELDTLIYMALEHNHDVLIAMSRIEQAYAVLGVSKADLFPQFGYDVSGSYGDPTTAGAAAGTGAGGMVTSRPMYIGSWTSGGRSGDPTRLPEQKLQLRRRRF